MERLSILKRDKQHQVLCLVFLMNEKVVIKGASESNKNLSFKVFRFTAALSVLIWHYQHFAYVKLDPIYSHNLLFFCYMVCR